MKYTIICCFLVLALAVVNIRANAQTKYSWSYSCTGKSVRNVISTNAQGGVRSAVGVGGCSGVTGEIGGSAIKSQSSATYIEAAGNEFKSWGAVVQTLANGDEVDLSTETRGTLVNGLQKNGSMTYQITGGTGKMAGITGSGGCTILYNPPPANTVASCSGEYKIP